MKYDFKKEIDMRVKMSEVDSFMDDINLPDLPSFTFPPWMNIKFTYPRCGAYCRFRVWMEDEDKDISVYLDTKDFLGGVGEPYWELYPNIEGGCSRYLLNETSELVQELKEILRWQQEQTCQ